MTTPSLVRRVFPLVKWAQAFPDEAGRPTVDERPSAFIVVLNDETFRDQRSAVNAGLAISNITLAAWSRGVGSCIIGNVAREPLRALLRIDRQFSIFALIALGYPSHQSTILEVEKDADTPYFIDENLNFIVSKRKVEDVADSL